MEFKNGDKVILGCDYHVFIGHTKDGKCCILYEPTKEFYEVELSQIAKPDILPMLEAVEEMMADLEGVEYCDRIQGRVRKVCAALYKLGYAKVD